MLRPSKSIAGVEVVPGAQVQVRSNMEQLGFTYVAVCESIDPEKWHGEARLMGTTLLATPAMDDYRQAGRAAETALKERLVALLCD